MRTIGDIMDKFNLPDLCDALADFLLNTKHHLKCSHHCSHSGKNSMGKSIDAYCY